MELLKFLRKSFFALFLLLIACLVFLAVVKEGAWLALLAKSWFEGGEYVQYSFRLGMIGDQYPFYMQAIYSLTLIGGLFVPIISLAVFFNEESFRPEKIAAAVFALLFPLTGPLIGMIIGLAISGIVLFIFMALICAFIFWALNELTHEKLLLTILSALLAAAGTFSYQAAITREFDLLQIIFHFFICGMSGALLEYLWLSNWWQMKVSHHLYFLGRAFENPDYFKVWWRARS